MAIQYCNPPPLKTVCTLNVSPVIVDKIGYHKSTGPLDACHLTRRQLVVKSNQSFSIRVAGRRCAPLLEEYRHCLSGGH